MGIEITTRPRSRRWQRVAARLSLLTAVLALALLLPASVGLSRHVVTDDAMGGSLSLGALVFDRPVRTAGQLRVGDVVTFVPEGARGPVTRRVVAIDGSRVLTRGDTRAGRAPVALDLDRVAPSRAVFAVPLVGYPELLTPWLTSTALVALRGVAALAALLAARREGAPGPVRAGPVAEGPTHAVTA